jgi:hypothetical protein
MAGHKFEVGQVVRFSPRKGMFPVGAQAYTIILVLPASECDEYQYRIKSVHEAFEWIAREGERSALAV